MKYQNHNLSIEERIDDLIANLTLDEKINCLSTDPSIPRLGIRGSDHVEGLHGLTQGGPAEWGGKSLSISTTSFPQQIGIGQTWDRSMAFLVGEIEGHECRYIFQADRYKRGGLVVRAPNADLGRDPRWGRTEECFGEDAFFNGSMVVSFIKGLQGNHPKYWRAASLMKHFLANSNEDDRASSSSDFDQRLFHEYYAAPFRMGVIEGGSRAFMAAYNAHNGTPCHIHPMLKDIAVKKWNQDGIICTDGGGLGLLHSHHKAFPTLAECAAACIKAGINQFLDQFIEPVKDALTQGILSVDDIEQVIRGPLRVMFKLGLFDPPELVPYSKIGLNSSQDPWYEKINKDAARLVTQKSIVLLKNDQSLLPLDRDSIQSIAVIGTMADSVLQDWYGGNLPYAVTALDGIQTYAGDQVKVRHAVKEQDAIEAARDCDIAILCVGNHPTGDAGWEKVTRPDYGKEAVDRKSLTLPEEELIKKIYAVNPRTVVVLISSFPYTINWTQDHVPAIVQMTHSSQEQGNALADVLFGTFNPAGRLVQTWPSSIDEIPPIMDYDIRNGRTYMYMTPNQVLYPFGHGLSYSSFHYENLSVSTVRDNQYRVQFNLTNQSDRDGEEVVQVYASWTDSKIYRPGKLLVGFDRVALRAKESRTVSIDISKSQFAHWSAEFQRFDIEPGLIRLDVGASSMDIRLHQIIEIRPDTDVDEPALKASVFVHRQEIIKT